LDDVPACRSKCVPVPESNQFAFANTNLGGLTLEQQLGVLKQLLRRRLGTKAAKSKVVTR
jgi:hypothetical protein